MKIDAIELTTPDIPEQRTFYYEALGLAIVREENDRITFAAGATHLVFQTDTGDSAPRYHFAFNIPKNRFEEAKRWLAERTPLLQDAAGNDTFRFDSWDADAVYAFDPAGNIIELIARQELDNATDHPFTGTDILSISEIGVPTDDVLALAVQLEASMGASLHPYRPGGADFMAVGDVEGLFILVRSGRLWYPDTGIAALPSPLVVTIRNDQGDRFTFTA